jgi:hypothetical protein
VVPQMRMRLGYLPSHLKKYRPQAPSKAQRRNSSDPPALRLLHFLPLLPWGTS